MTEKTPWTQRANKEVAATLSTGAGTHGKGSIPSAQADLLDLNSTSIKPAVFLLLFLHFFKVLKQTNKNNLVPGSYWKRKFQSFILSTTKEVFRMAVSVLIHCRLEADGGEGREAGGLPFLAEQPVSVLWLDGSSLRRVHRSFIFYTGAVRFSSCCICVSACVCEEEPEVSAFSKRNEHSELYVLRHNFASTLVCPVTCHYVKFPLVFPSLSMNVAVIEGGQSR